MLHINNEYIIHIPVGNYWVLSVIPLQRSLWWRLGLQSPDIGGSARNRSHLPVSHQSMNIIQFKLKTVLKNLDFIIIWTIVINNFQNDTYSVKILILGNLMENLTDFCYFYGLPCMLNMSHIPVSKDNDELV